VKKALLIISSLIALILSGFLLVYLFRWFMNPSVDPSPPECSTTKCNNTKELDLIDIDLFIVSTNHTSDLVHINYVDNRSQSYSQAQVVYSLGGKPLVASQIPFKSIEWRQISENTSNLEYSFSGSFRLGGDTVEFEIPSINLEMVIRASQDVGKFGGVTPNASVKINGVESSAHVAVTAGFFNKFVPVNIAAQKVRTDWMMYFDKDWNFYHLDKTETEIPTADYYPHSFLAEVASPGGTVRYLDDFSLSKPDPQTLSLRSMDGDTQLDENYTVEDSVIPYRGAKLSLIRGTNGGIGVHLYISGDSSN
jgi:hypothetical protein